MKSKAQKILVSYSDAFVALLPYTLIWSIVTLFSLLNSPVQTELKAVSTELNNFPIIFIISISYQLARRAGLNISAPVFLSLALYLTSKALGLPPSISGLAVFPIPIIAVSSLAYMERRKKNRFGEIGSEFDATFASLFPSITTYLVFAAAIAILGVFLGPYSLMTIQNELSDLTIFILRAITANLGWFFGIHGALVFDSVFGIAASKTPIFEKMTYRQFYNIFIIYGGSGVGFSLIAAIFISAKDKHSIRIAKLSSIFAIFNINEILIFGLPIVLNRILIIPFVLVPLINIGLAYTFFSFYPIEIVVETSWLTPMFFSAFISTGGNWVAVFLQLFLLIVGTIIYIPFVKRYSSTQSKAVQNHTLREKLDLQSLILREEGLKSHEANREIIETNKIVGDILEIVSSNNLFVYYEPIVDIENNGCVGFEALIRIRLKNGRVEEPTFLQEIDLAGLSPVLETWLCARVAEDVKDGFSHPIVIRLSKSTLLRNGSIEEICGLLSGLNIDFDITDATNDEISLTHAKYLKELGFSLSSTYGKNSDIVTLCTFPIDSIKVGQSLINQIHTPKGYIFCKSVVSICSDLGITSTAGGVETADQYELISRLGLNKGQGYYFSSPLFVSDAKIFLEADAPKTL